jgi:hypothetical protein
MSSSADESKDGSPALLVPVEIFWVLVWPLE